MKKKDGNQTAKQAYKAAKMDIGTLIEWLQSELDWQDSEIKDNSEEINWGHVGSLQKVRSDLLETVTFISGHEADDLNIALEEARN